MLDFKPSISLPIIVRLCFSLTLSISILHLLPLLFFTLPFPSLLLSFYACSQRIFSSFKCSSLKPHEGMSGCLLRIILAALDNDYRAHFLPGLSLLVAHASNSVSHYYYYYYYYYYPLLPLKMFQKIVGLKLATTTTAASRLEGSRIAEIAFPFYLSLSFFFLLFDHQEH